MNRETAEYRAAYIKGLRDVADFLEANPDVPIGAHKTTRVQYSVSAYRPWITDFPAACAEVERVADLINRETTETGEPGEGWCETERHFGPVSYSAVAIEKESDK